MESLRREMSDCICKYHHRIVIPGCSILAGPAVLTAPRFADTQKVRIWLSPLPGISRTFLFKYRNPVGILDATVRTLTSETCLWRHHDPHKSALSKGILGQQSLFYCLWVTINFISLLFRCFISF